MCPVLACLVAAGVLIGCEGIGLLGSPPAVPVARVVRRTMPLSRAYPARAKAVQSVEVRARVEGYLLERAFEDGTEVEQNQLLFRIQPDAYAAALERAKAELTRNLATLDLARDRLAQNPPRARSDAAAPPTREQLEVSAAEAAVEASRAAVRQAEIDLSYATVLSPINGRIDERTVDVGNLVGSGERTLLATVTQLDPIYVEFEVPARDLPALLASQHEAPLRVEIGLPDGTRHPRDGRVDFTSSTVDPSSQTASVRAVVPNPDDRLRPGEPLRAGLFLGWKKDALVVPAHAVREEGGEASVLVVGPDGRVARRSVVASGTEEGLRMIEQGLEAGDLVVLQTPPDVEPGTIVRPEERPIEETSESSDARATLGTTAE